MLEELNPWWFTENWEKNDIHLSNWQKQEIKWIPKWIDKVSLEPFSLNFVIGPRQVGKTTGLKLLIKRLIESCAEPKDIVYVNCDLISSLKDLLRILKKITDYKYIFLDEVTSIEYWWKGVKGFIDAGLFVNNVVTISGSSSIKLKKYFEAFPGRRGKGKNITVLPLSFPEFVEVKYEKEAYGLKLQKAFEEYLQIGGFPRSVNRDKTFSEDLIYSIDREISRIGRDPKIAKALIYSIIKKAPSAVSYSALGKEVELNHVITREYLSILEDIHIAKIIFLKEGKNIKFKKEKKVILRDSFIAKTFASIYDLELSKSVLLEWVVQEHLLRKFGEIYYYRNHYEIDCIAGNLKVEVKTGKPHRKYPKNVLILDEENIPKFLFGLFKKDFTTFP